MIFQRFNLYKRLPSRGRSVFKKRKKKKTKKFVTNGLALVSCGASLACPSWDFSSFSWGESYGQRMIKFHRFWKFNSNFHDIIILQILGFKVFSRFSLPTYYHTELCLTTFTSRFCVPVWLFCLGWTTRWFIFNEKHLLAVWLFMFWVNERDDLYQNEKHLLAFCQRFANSFCFFAVSALCALFALFTLFTLFTRQPCA